MGCIEIGYYAVSIDWMVWINRNMGCIEIIDRIRQITRLPEKVSPPDRGGES